VQAKKKMKGSTLFLKKTKDSLRLLGEASKRFHRDHGFLLSSAITFSFLICMIPIILLLLVLIGPYLYSSREILNHITYHLQNIIPSLDPEILRNVMRIIRQRKIVGVLSIGGLIWTSTWVFSSLRTVLNRVFRVERNRGAFRGKAVDLLLVFFTGIFFLLSMVLTSFVNSLHDPRYGSLLDVRAVTRFTLKYLVPFLITSGMGFTIYKIIPNRSISSRSALEAALFTSLLWEIGQQLFGWYVSYIGRFAVIYGALSAVAVFFLFVYYSSAILILGGEIAYLLERRE
jgi:membrane protein